METVTENTSLAILDKTGVVISLTNTGGVDYSFEIVRSDDKNNSYRVGTKGTISYELLASFGMRELTNEEKTSLLH